MPITVLALTGDGIGPEITPATIRVLRAATDAHGIDVAVETEAIGLATLASEGTTLPQRVLDRIPAVDGVILGPVSHYDYPPKSEGGFNPSAELRVQFALNNNIRPCTSREGLTILRRPMDLVIVRENTEGFYSDRNMYAGCGEFMPDADTVLSIRKITTDACTKVARTAFELASTRRKKVTAVHKANAVKLSDGHFLTCVRAVADEFPGVELEELIVDAAAAALVRRPDSFDVIVTTNMFGDILSDEAAELSGSLGLGGSLNCGDTIGVAQAAHGSAPDIAGQGIANPTSLILSAAMLLRWLGQRRSDDALLAAADSVDAAVEKTLAEPDTRTRDLGGTLSTAEFTDAVIANL